MITYKEVDKTYFTLYDSVSMNVDVCSEYKVKRVDNGLGGLLLEEIPACRFYQKQGAVLAKIDMYAYYFDPAIRDEVQFVWYLDI